MYTIKRILPKTKPWKTGFTWVFAAAIGYGTSIIIQRFSTFPTYRTQPVLAEIFGDTIQLQHALIIALVIISVVIALELQQIRFFANPYSQIVHEELRNFTRLFQLPIQTKPHVGISKKQLLLLGFFLPIGIVVWVSPKIFNRIALDPGITRYIAVAVSILYLLGLIIWFVSLFRKRKQDGVTILNDICARVQGRDGSTQLHPQMLGDYHIPLRNFQLAVDGLFRGRRVLCSARVNDTGIEARTAFSTYHQMRIHQLAIHERNPEWKTLKGRDVNDCFQKRFEVVGMEAQYIPQQLKELLVRAPQPIHLNLSNQQIIFENTHALPFYSIEGLFVWLHLCNQIVSSVEQI
ncbi:MAG: hypothetical protein HYV32_01555 [Candidatus Kerfeldbacteria bacterium]|nr:hypothetical protein [Candidatus Kerfeldbacteria bacterium]